MSIPQQQPALTSWGRGFTRSVSTTVSMVVVLLCLLNAAAFAVERPNIIFLFADDQCKYSMGCYDTPGAQTPNLDQLSAEGMTFDRHYDTTAICMASRVNVMTGLLEYRAGCNFESGDLVRDRWERSYPILLRKAGYQTAFAGKFGFLVCDEPETKGELPKSDFDVWRGGPGQTSYDTAKNDSMKEYAERYPHSTLSYGAFGSDFVKGATEEDSPFCLSISFKAPHHPVQPDSSFNDVFQGTVFTKPANFGREHGQQMSVQSRQGRQYERFYSWSYAGEYQKTMALYYQQIYAIDVAVGMIRGTLRECGVAGNTVIIYSSDNGFLCGSHGYGSKVLPYEESACVPLIIYDPRKPLSAGQRCDSLTGNVDIYSTILSLAGVQEEVEVDGFDLMPLLDDPTRDVHPYLPLINTWGPKQVHSFGVVTERGKLIYWPFQDEFMKPTWEAYNMRDDRLEQNNLIQENERPELLTSLEEAYSSALEHWKSKAVPYHGYQRFGSIFDADVDWADKEGLY
ncbi:MAG: sulfatase-like hydrolase/transferase [Pirellulaceae bacterium]